MPQSKRFITRFAPSPTGLLHVGNAYSALYCQQWAQHHDAQLLLRIEDIDFTRCRSEFSDALIEDLQWLGIEWHQPPTRQSEHSGRYNTALKQLHSDGMIYPCFCTRKEIREEWERMGVAPHADDPSSDYPGTCKRLSRDEQQARMITEQFAWRLDIDRANGMLSETLFWQEANGTRHQVILHHDFVIGRKDIGFSYHLAVTIDDAASGITHVIRGLDLEESTGIQRMLQHLLDLPAPLYIHHPLLLDNQHKRLAKRHHATTLKSLREMGVDASKLARFLIAQQQPCWPFEDDDDVRILDTLGISA